VAYGQPVLDGKLFIPAALSPEREPAICLRWEEEWFALTVWALWGIEESLVPHGTDSYYYTAQPSSFGRNLEAKNVPQIFQPELEARI
jgi:hypothetical protein